MARISVMTALWLSVIVGSAVAASPPAGALASSPEVRTTSGMVAGESLEGGVVAFKGIPFAAPPVGELRWRPPQPVEPWRGVRRTTEFASACAQIRRAGAFSRKYPGYSEDCLYLNVWTPPRSTEQRLPVMLWYHGGGFAIGSASDDAYDGRFLARKGVVVVTTNYRLGPIGFLAHPSLSEESGKGISGNYGLLDMIAALEWVRDNIGSFGGDPDRVTIFGESAGGRCVAHLMATPAAKGLFHRGIMQSSSLYRPLSHLRERYYERPSAEDTGLGVSARLGCGAAEDPLACLRSRSAEDVIEAAKVARGLSSDGNFHEPIVDGVLLPDDPSQIFEDGRQHRVPVIAGSNADESTVFVPRGLIRTRQQVLDATENMVPGHAAALVEMFQTTGPEDAWRAASRIHGDWMFTMPILKTVRAAGRVGAPAYHYFFSHVRSDETSRRLGAYHGSEIRFAFANLDLGGAPVTAADRELARKMSSYWVNFATTGDPNGEGLPSWPRFAPDEEPYLVLGENIRVDHHLRPDIMAVMERIEAGRRRTRAE